MNKVMMLMTLATDTSGPSDFDSDLRAALSATCLILMVLAAIALVIVVLMQRSSEGGIGAISGGSNDTYFGKNKTRSKEGRLKIATISIACSLLVISVVYFIIQLIN